MVYGIASISSRRRNVNGMPMPCNNNVLWTIKKAIEEKKNATNGKKFEML
jgi:hypothetical protein